MKNLAQLFITGMTQVFFVAANTYFLANAFYLGVAFCGFMISWIWTYNVKKIAVGTTRERIAYCMGAATGSLLGLFISTIIL